MTGWFFAPLGRSLSRVVLGTSEMSREWLDRAFEILGEWIALGGKVLDTAAVYGNGESERVLGMFFEAVACREEVVVVTKGCHPKEEGAPRVTPAALHEDLEQSLSRLRTGYVDIFMLHRDDASARVEPLIEALNEELAAGRVRSVGASNWSASRVQEANAFAERHGMAGFTSSSCQLSLAVQKQPLAADCLSVHNPRDLAFYRETGMPLFAWAALAGGFFRDEEDPEVSRVYGCADNRERRLRASRLHAARVRASHRVADDAGRSPAQSPERAPLSASQVALAWVLNQGFPTFAVVSTRKPHHLRQLSQAADIRLSARETAWLDLEGDTWPEEMTADNG